MTEPSGIGDANQWRSWIVTSSANGADIHVDANCPNCDAPLKLQRDWAGKRATCNSCKVTFTIPSLPPSVTAPPERPQSRQLERNQIDPQLKVARPSSDSVRKAELNRLIIAAASGDADSSKRLISPFVTPEEKLLMYGMSAKFGFFPTYDFYFLTDRRIGDLQITPLTGNLNVEVAYIQKIDAFVLSQPAFPIWFRLLLAFMYILMPFGIFMLIEGLMNLPLPVVVLFGLPAAAGGAYLVFLFVNPALKRLFLRLKKSGLWLKLHGSPMGVLIFADRNKFELLTSLSRALSDVKRHLDKAAS
jgi:hypothetical protein